MELTTQLNVREWLEEDDAWNDVTTQAVVPEDATCEAELLLQEPGIVCGLDAVEAVFAELDPGVRIERLMQDGDLVQEIPAVLARISGPGRSVLTGERTALNVLGRLSGIATLTRRFVGAVEGTGATILDTRKTTPGLRALEKEAVRAGGGTNHRFSLGDGVLIKDNHLRLAGSLAAAVAQAKETSFPVEVECDTLEQVAEALDAGADRILLDNMTPDQLRDAVALADGRVELEASGGVTLETARAIAETGIDLVSVGALTRSARSLDVSLELR